MLNTVYPREVKFSSFDGKERGVGEGGTMGLDLAKNSTGIYMNCQT